jgi:hypothetical protein
MPPALAAMQKGVRYQLRIFWQMALRMLYDSDIVEVEMECRDVQAVDDLKVVYQKSGIMDKGTLVHVDYFQVKFHVSQAGHVDAESLINSKWSGTKEPMLKRFWQEWQKLEQQLRPQEQNFRLILKTNWPWDRQCPVAKRLDDDGRLNGEFFAAKDSTDVGKIRCRWQEACAADDAETFNRFLQTLRFKIESLSLADNDERLRDICRLAGASVMPANLDLNVYDDLSQQLLQQGRTHHTPESLRRLLEQNRLLVPQASRLAEATVNENELPRLLCFVECVLKVAPPDISGRPSARKFRVRFWLSQRQGSRSPLAPEQHSPSLLAQHWIDEIAGDRLAHEIAEVYSVQLNKSPNGRLLLALFLPSQDLVADGLPAFLQQLRQHVKFFLPNCTGIPLLLACSSRWVGSSAHPKISNTQADLRKASVQLINTLFLGSSQGQSSMKSLNWLMIDLSEAETRQVNTQQARKPKPQAFPSVVDGNQLFRNQDGSVDSDDVIDSLANRNAVYLSEAAAKAHRQNHQNPFDHLLMRGVPLIWCEAQVNSEVQEPVADGTSRHPMDSILEWDGQTFLEKLYRFQHERASEDDEPDLPLRHHIRNGIIFWEDHRHIPTEPTRKGSAPVKFQDPFLHSRP